MKNRYNTKIIISVSEYIVLNAVLRDNINMYHISSNRPGLR